MPESSAKPIHQGRNIKRFREMIGMKQETLAFDLGEDWNQKKVSRLEEKEIVDGNVLSQVAQILKVPEDLLRNFDEENSIFNVQHNYDGTSNNNTIVSSPNNYISFNPIDKIILLFEENKKLYEENKALYERLLASEREKLAIFKDK